MASNPEIGPELRLRSKAKGLTAAQRSTVFQAFEQLRKRVHEQMAILETLVRRHDASQTAISEPDLCQQQIELEQARLALKAERDRIERERYVVLEELAHDRQLLAQAWENLEREQVKMAVLVAEDRRPIPLTLQSPQQRPPSSTADQSEMISRAVLEQFHTLRRDVRNNEQAKK
jgi:hypothetical protein